MTANKLGRSTLRLLKPLKTFAWLLDDGQRAKCKAWANQNCDVAAKIMHVSLEDIDA